MREALVRNVKGGAKELMYFKACHYSSNYHVKLYLQASEKFYCLHCDLIRQCYFQGYSSRSLLQGDKNQARIISYSCVSI